MIIHPEMTLDELLDYYEADAMLYNQSKQRKYRRASNEEGRATTRLHRQHIDSDRGEV